jgi:hypothetical protein
LSFRSQVYQRGICLLPAATTADSSRDKPRFGMTIPWGSDSTLPNGRYNVDCFHNPIEAQ